MHIIERLKKMFYLYIQACTPTSPWKPLQAITTQISIAVRYCTTKNQRKKRVKMDGFPYLLEAFVSSNPRVDPALSPQSRRSFYDRICPGHPRCPGSFRSRPRGPWAFCSPSRSSFRKDKKTKHAKISFENAENLLCRSMLHPFWLDSIFILCWIQY